VPDVILFLSVSTILQWVGCCLELPNANVPETGTPPSGDISPVSQMSPFNMSPLSGSPAGSAGASPIAGDGMLGSAYGSGSTSIASKIHSRRFRE
jgi:hypothetical protein